MATITDYVSLETIIERVNSEDPSNGERAWSSDDMLEWIGQAIEMIGGVQPYVEMTATIEINQGKGSLPSRIRDLIEVLEYDLNVPMEDVGNTGDFKDFSYKAHGGSIYTDFETGKIFLRYLSPPTDDRGYPLILNEERYIKGVVSYCLERIAKRLLIRRQIDGGIYQIFERDKSYYMMAARNATRNTNPDRLANLQREIYKPYSDVRRKRSKTRWH